ncbi:MAG: family 16 glycoside hydrolase [Bacteroidales bacterium]
MRSIKLFSLLFICLFCMNSCKNKNEEQWISIFNGKNLDGWTPKITGYKAGENPLDGFRVENGILKVDYSKFKQFNGRFGHLFYRQKLSSYILRVEYRFVGELLPDAPGYCYRNSGVMIHSQSPESMDIAQNWPVSLEAQILGSTSKLKQLTANICTPGTTVFYNETQSEEHCINSTSKYYYDNEWVTMDIIVHGSREIIHVINGDTVLKYSNPKVGGFLLPENYPVASGTLLNDGYIALQAEGQPIEFRKVELKILNEDPGQSILSSNSAIQADNQGTSLKMIENFDNYPNNEELSKTWYQPGHGGRMTQNLDSKTKGSGKYSLRCDYTTEKSDVNFYCPVCRVSKWDLSGCNGIQFWFKPDGSGREFTIELNIADKNGKNIHDLWGYKYLTEKGDTAGRIVTVPFFNLKHNTKFADSPNVSSTFKPESVIEVAIYIGGRNDEPGKGTFYFDEIAGSKLQF